MTGSGPRLTERDEGQRLGVVAFPLVDGQFGGSSVDGFVASDVSSLEGGLPLGQGGSRDRALVGALEFDLASDAAVVTGLDVEPDVFLVPVGAELVRHAVILPVANELGGNSAFVSLQPCGESLRIPISPPDGKDAP